MKLKIEGLKEVQEALRQLPKTTGKNVMKRVLMKRAEPLADMVRQKAPVRTGRLRESIVVQVRGGGAGKAAFAEAMREGATRAEAGQAAREANRAAGNSVEVLIGPTDRAFYAHMVEFGTVHSPPAPFMRPAWDSAKAGLLTGLTDDMWAEIEKAVLRRAKRLAKAAKAGG